MNQIVNQFLGPSGRIQVFKQGLISALKCINIKHRCKEFSNTIYGDYGDWQQVKIVRKNSEKRVKKYDKNQQSCKNIKLVRERNSFPRPHHNLAKYKNMNGKVEKRQKQQKNKEEKEKAYRQTENHKKITLNIRTIRSTKKLPRISNQKNLTISTTSNLNQKPLNELNETNLQPNNQFLSQQNLIIVNRLKNTLKLNKKLFNSKPDKPLKKYNTSKANSLELAHTPYDVNKTTNPLHEYSKAKDKMDICSWFEQEQYKQSNMQTPTFGML